MITNEAVKPILVVVLIYILIISVIGWLLPYIDKNKAQNGKWRVRESTLFLVAALGGSAAMYASMQKYRHKTKHKRFMIGIPCIMFVQLAVIALLVYKFILQLH